MINDIYALPDINFIGGCSFPFSFALFKDELQTIPFDLDAGMSVLFSATHYTNRDYASPAFMLKSEDQDGSITYQQSENGHSNILTVQIPFDITHNLFGKYIYQITLFSEDRQPEVLGQGIMNITRNIDSSTYTN